MKLSQAVAVSLFLMTLGSPALARSSQRLGFNFGTTVRTLGTNEQTQADNPGGHNTQVQSSGTGINAYAGYAFSFLDFGLMYSTESTTTQSTATTPDGATTTTSKTSVTDSGGSLYLRYLFGTYFYFEGGLGVYQQAMKVLTQTTQNQGANAFSGQQDEHDFNGMGPGYHFGGGVELPVTNGFYFTAAYQARMVQLRDHVSSTDLGTNRSQEQKHELLFGIAYYDH